VLGLTTALELATSHTPSQAPIHIHILARDLPLTPAGLASQGWSSPWAGFNWCSFAPKDDIITQERDKLAYNEWKRMVKDKEMPSETMASMPFKHYLPGEYKRGDLWFEDFVDDFRYHPSSAHEPRHYITYTSFGVNTPLYLAYLTDTFSSLGSVYTHCATTISPSSDPASWLVINASGLGSLYLTDVLDKAVHPIRGQTVLLSVPTAFTSNPRCVMDASDPKAKPTYLIPRGRGSGQVILGGTFGVDEWEREPSEEDTARILRDCWKLCPDILEGHTVDEEQIISVNVGLRPARRGDVTRVELDAVKLGEGPKGGMAPVLHCYGAGKAGYQTSMGVAREARELVERHYAELER
ncbi:hypothetical protein BDZ90DRAFT_218088, partial [Jaminaea rosea]